MGRSPHGTSFNFAVSSTVVLSSDEEEDADNASTGSANQLDSVSPRPADSAHSSPAPCGSGGKVEAAVKNTLEQDEFGVEFFEDVNLKVTIPRRARMKDQVRKYSVDPYREDGREILSSIIFPSLEISHPSSVPQRPRSPSNSPVIVSASYWNVGVSESGLCAGWSKSPSL